MWSGLYFNCDPPEEQCQLDPRVDLYDDIEPAPADD